MKQKGRRKIHYNYSYGFIPYGEKQLCRVKAYLYGAVEVSGEAVLNEQGGEIEHSQQQGLEVPVVWPVAHQQP